MTLKLSCSAGKQYLIIDGAKYRETRTLRDSIFWRCCHNGCNSWVKTNLEKDTKIGSHILHKHKSLVCNSGPNSKSNSPVAQTQTMKTPKLANKHNSSYSLQQPPTTKSGSEPYIDDSLLNSDTLSTSTPKTKSDADISQLEMENASLREMISILNKKLDVVTNHAIAQDARLLQYTNDIFTPNKKIAQNYSDIPATPDVQSHTTVGADEDLVHDHQPISPMLPGAQSHAASGTDEDIMHDHQPISPVLLGAQSHTAGGVNEDFKFTHMLKDEMDRVDPPASLSNYIKWMEEKISSLVTELESCRQSCTCKSSKIDIAKKQLSSSECNKAITPNINKKTKIRYKEFKKIPIKQWNNMHNISNQRKNVNSNWYRLDDDHIKLYLDKLHLPEKTVVMYPSISHLLKIETDPVVLADMCNSANLRSAEYLLTLVNDRTEEDREGGSHWSLLVYNRAAATYYHLDSMSPSNRVAARTLASKLSPFMSGPVKEVKCRQQQCGVECGVYALHFVELACSLIHNNLPPVDDHSFTRAFSINRIYDTINSLKRWPDNPGRATPRPGPARGEATGGRVSILADSHGRDLRRLLQSKLGRRYSVYGKIMPNAKFKNVCDDLGNEAKHLGSSDHLIIIGGTNDVDVCSNEPFDVKTYVKFIGENTKHTNVLLSTIPLRFDRPDLNVYIRKHNIQLIMSAMEYNHIKIVSTYNISRSHYTTHGLHLKYSGKCILAYNLAKYIRCNTVRTWCETSNPTLN